MRQMQVIADQDLRERHLGDLQGLVYHDLAKLNPKASEAFRSPRSDQEIPVCIVPLFSEVWQR